MLDRRAREAVRLGLLTTKDKLKFDGGQWHFTRFLRFALTAVQSGGTQKLLWFPFELLCYASQ